MRAFSLIELMIVITIIGILAAVAVPSYQNYVERSKNLDLIQYGRKFRLMIDEYYQIHQAFPTTSQLGLTASGTYLDGSYYASSDVVKAIEINPAGPLPTLGYLDVSNGTQAEFCANNAVRIRLLASLNNGVVSWQCQVRCGDSSKAPSNCICLSGNTDCS